MGEFDHISPCWTFLFLKFATNSSPRVTPGHWWTQWGLDFFQMERVSNLRMSRLLGTKKGKTNFFLGVNNTPIYRSYLSSWEICPSFISVWFSIPGIPFKHYNIYPLLSWVKLKLTWPTPCHVHLCAWCGLVGRYLTMTMICVNLWHDQHHSDLFTWILLSVDILCSQSDRVDHLTWSYLNVDE